MTILFSGTKLRIKSLYKRFLDNFNSIFVYLKYLYYVLLCGYAEMVIPEPKYFAVGDCIRYINKDGLLVYCKIIMIYGQCLILKPTNEF